ncbi:MAG: hypothetical protein ABSE77_11340 [Acidimicrobiales bacterium]
MSWLSRFGQSRERLAGPPTSSNGASSFHLWWDVPPGPFQEVSAVLEVTRAPAVRKLYFWALQVSFVDQGRDLGAGHTGLQWHPGAPAGAVNWGGYHAGGGVLDGTGSDLPPVDGPHTRHFAWSAGRPYRLRVWSPAPGAWRSEVTDLSTGQATVIRDLLVPATGLANPVVWAEVFADCDDAPTEARWSQLQAGAGAGQLFTATSVRLTYQAHAEGGCANTLSYAWGSSFVQATGLPGARRPGPDVVRLER